MDNKKRFFTKRSITIIVAGCALVGLFVLLQNIGSVAEAFSTLMNILKPFFWGLAIAYVLNLIMNPIEKYIFKFVKHQKLKRAFSVLLTVVLFLVLIGGLIFALVPQLIESVGLLLANLQGYLDTAINSLSEFAARFDIAPAFLENIFGSWESNLESIVKWATGLIPDVLDYSLRLGKGIVTSLISLVISIYVLFDKERLLRQCRMITRALFREKSYDRMHDIAMRSHRAFGGFLGGKTLDSVIIGILCFIFMIIFQMPYAVLISFIIGITNIVPTFGPIIGGVPCALIVMMVDFRLGIIFGIFIIVLQQFDGNILGPFILSDTVGLSALWILVSVVVGGAMFGVIGMIIGVPLFAVIYDLAAEFVKKRLVSKGVIKPPGDDDAEHGLQKMEHKPFWKRFSKRKKQQQTKES